MRALRLDIGTSHGLIVRSRLVGAAGGAVVGALVLCGYAADIGPAWRLAPGLPATHPLTATCLMLLGLGLLPVSDKLGPALIAARAAVLLAFAILLLRLAAPWVGSGVLADIMPFRRIMAAELEAGTPITMGTNTACAVVAIAASDISRWFRWRGLSQAMACCAIGFLFVAIIGYLDGLATFHGAMAPQTLLAVFLLVVAVVFATPQHDFMHTLAARSEPARLARLLLGCSTPLVLLIGWLMSRLLSGSGPGSLEAETFLAYQTAAVIIITWILVTVATTRAERIDRRRRAAETSLLQAARTDALTGLLSRNQMEQLRSRGESDHQQAVAATLFIDLDRFRAVNEAFGHEVGDDMLVEVGRRLRTIAGDHPVGRVGGDEFAIYCTGVSPREAEQMGLAATAILGVPFKIRERSFHLTASVGVAHSDTATETDLRQAADSAMHVAKRRGGNQSMTFVASMHEERRGQIELEQDLYEALDHPDELSLVYQPVIRLADRRLIAVEALARWAHPQLGPISPQRFIQIAEATGLIIPLGLKLMAAAVGQAALWRTLYRAEVPTINLNISPVQLAAGDVIGDLTRMLRQEALPPSAICIELTEGAFTDEHAIGALHDARQAGFKVAMDDFGVGYSSLSQLPRLPLASVKLDRSLTLDATASTGGAIMLTAIVQLAHGLGLTVVAEGVERPDQLDLLRRAGCDAVQGFIFAQPMRPDELEAWVATVKQEGVVA